MEAHCNLIASNFVARPQILIFLVLKNEVSFPILIANKISHVTVLLDINFCDQFVAPKIRHRRETSLQCFVNMVFSDEEKILIKSFYWKGYTAKRLTDEFPEKRWTKPVLICC